MKDEPIYGTQNYNDIQGLISFYSNPTILQIQNSSLVIENDLLHSSDNVNVPIKYIKIDQNGQSIVYS